MTWTDTDIASTTLATDKKRKLKELLTLLDDFEELTPQEKRAHREDERRAKLIDELMDAYDYVGKTTCKLRTSKQ